jgi:hypothetical protein
MIWPSAASIALGRTAERDRGDIAERERVVSLPDAGCSARISSAAGSYRPASGVARGAAAPAAEVADMRVTSRDGGWIDDDTDTASDDDDDDDATEDSGGAPAFFFFFFFFFFFL